MIKNYAIFTLIFCSYLCNAQFLNPKGVSTVDEVEVLLEQYIENNFTEERKQTIEIPKNIEVSEDQYRSSRLKNILTGEFFERNESYKKLYNNINESRIGGCLNSGFEQGTGQFNFFRHSYAPTNSGFNGCNTNVNTLIPTPPGALNQNNLVNLVSPGFDPTLQNLFNIQLPRVLNGQRAIRINNDVAQNNQEIVTMSRNYLINSDQLIFNFAAVMEDDGHAAQNQPFFQVRLYDQNNNWVNQNTSNCIVTSLTDCIFINGGTVNNVNYLYIPWTCYTLDTSQLLGQQIRVEWSVGDCGFQQHSGYVYIDDVCDSVCQSPAFGSLDLQQIDGECPEYPITVCANYIPPVVNNNGTNTFNSANIYLEDSNDQLINLNLTPSSVTGNQICFEINENDIPSTTQNDTYEIIIDALFTLNCNTVPQQFTLTDSSTNQGPDISFPNNCCVTPFCPDIFLNKFVVSNNTTPQECLDYDPGDEITFRVCVRNDEDGSCPINFEIDDVIDPQFFDISTLSFQNLIGLPGQNGLPSYASIQDDNLTINVENLGENQQRCYTYTITLRDDVLPEEGTNCATITRRCGVIENCANFCVNLPDTLWPRTFGNYSEPDKIKYYDVTTDGSGNVYAFGLANTAGSISYENPNFSVQSLQFLTKFNSAGFELWTTPINDGFLEFNGGLLFHNNHIFLLTDIGMLYKIDLNGSIVSQYDTGGDRNFSLEINTNNNNIYVATTYESYFENNDYTVNGFGQNKKTRILKFNSNLDYLDFVEFEQNINVFYPGYMYINDLAFAKDVNKLFVVGLVVDNLVIPNNPPHLIGSEFFIMSITDSTLNSLQVDTGIVYEQEQIDEIGLNVNTDKLYINRNNSLYEYDYLINNDVFISSFGVANSNINDLLVEDNIVYLLSTFGNLDGYFTKIDLTNPFFNPVWESFMPELGYTSLTKNDKNIYTTGKYVGEINFGDFYRPEYELYGAFVARMEDQGFSLVFKSESHNSKPNSLNSVKVFNIFPNPTSNKFTIHTQVENVVIDNVVIRNLNSKVLKYIDVNLTNTVFVDELNLSSGLYYIEINYNDNLREVLTVIIR